jgi:hypothetical protein
MLESVETGALCKWSNIDLSICDRDLVANHPEWRWHDSQFDFSRRWISTSRRAIDTFPLVANPAEFLDDNSVRLTLRPHVWLGGGRDKFKPMSKVFLKWHKLPRRAMVAFAKDALEKFNNGHFELAETVE